MKNISIRNKELQRLNTIIGMLLAMLTLLFCALSIYFGFMLLIAFVIMSKATGVEIDFETSRYRSYKSIIGRRTGEWKTIPENAELIVITKQGAQSTTGTNGTSDLKTKAQFYELYLMDKTHQNRFYLYSTENKKSMDILVQVITENSNLTLGVYSPKK